LNRTSDAAGTGIAVHELSKQFKANGPYAVDHVSLTVEPGEFMTFLGPSGSGKSTTLSMIAGFTPATSGTIELDGVDVSRLAPHRRDLGMVFQNYALFPHMSAERNIAFPLRERKVPKAQIRSRVAEALDLVHLTGRGSSLPKNLSGGEQQRVALARALVYRPRALLLDEPLGALDKRLRESMQLEIGRIHRELGVTFLFVTHDQEEALALSDRIAVFNKGTVQQVGTPQELYDRPSSVFVARFLGDSNVLTGVLRNNAMDCSLGTVQVAPDRRAIAGEVAMVVRPERCTLHASEPALGDQYNVFQARITGWTYLGAQRKVAVEFADGTAGCVSERAGQELDVVLGQNVSVAWRADDSWVVAPSSSANPASSTAAEPAEIPTV
jgi:putative spermidine/putrescine transport system ATP-binding protein